VVRLLKQVSPAIARDDHYQATKTQCRRKNIQSTHQDRNNINAKLCDGCTAEACNSENQNTITNSTHTLYNNTPCNDNDKKLYHIFKSIIFDNGKEFSNSKHISNKQDIDIYFADPGTPSQRGLNEHSNGLLRKNGLPKVMDFNSVSQEEISHVVFQRNNIPRKSLNYQTPIECFMSYVGDKF